MHFSLTNYIIPWLGWISTNACAQIRVSATSADCFVAMPYREMKKYQTTWIVSFFSTYSSAHSYTYHNGNGDELTLHLLTESGLPKWNLYLLYTYLILIYTSYLLHNEHNLN